MALIRQGEQQGRVVDEINRLTQVRRAISVKPGPSGVNAVRVDQNGNVGIGVDPAVKLHVGGPVRATEFQHLSSAETKEIHGMVNQQAELDGVCGIPVYHYTSKVDHGEHIGPVAEDAGNGRHISLIDMNGRLIAAVQALKSRIDALESRSRKSVRVLETGDHVGLDDVMRLSAAFAREVGLPETSPEDYRWSLLRYIAGTGETWAAVLYEEQMPVATVGALLQPIRWRKGTECVVPWVIVDPRWRKRGVGRLLVQEVEKWADSRGATYVVMTPMVASGSGDAAEALGYEPFEVWHRKELP